MTQQNEAIYSLVLARDKIQELVQVEPTDETVKRLELMLPEENIEFALTVVTLASTIITESSFELEDKRLILSGLTFYAGSIYNGVDEIPVVMDSYGNVNAFRTNANQQIKEQVNKLILLFAKDLLNDAVKKMKPEDWKVMYG